MSNDKLTAAREAEREIYTEACELLTEFRGIVLRLDEVNQKIRRASVACGNVKLGDFLIDFDKRPGVVAAVGILSRVVTKDAAERVRGLLDGSYAAKQGREQ